MIILNGYERRTQQKKELILQTAAEMFLKNGISNTNVSDIAHKAKVSKVTIFKYFESKENLARKALNSYFSIYMEKFTRILDAKEPLLEKMPKLFSLAKENVTTVGSGLFSEEVWKDPDIQQIYKDITSQAMTSMVSFIEQGKNEEIIDPSIPSEAILAFISMWASLSNPGTHEVSIEYTLGVSKLFYFGVFGDKYSFDERMKLFKAYERSITGQDSN